MPSRAHRQAWQDWGTVNPLYGILTDPRYRHGGDIDEFLATGEGTVTATLAELDRLGLCHRRRAALDFGCGVGRLTAPLARRFDEVTGVDVSASMVATARRLHASLTNCHFVVSDADDLGRFDATAFDLAISLFVLQHLESTLAIETYLSELVRVVAPGGALVVQLCSELPANRSPLPPWRSREGVRARAAIALRRLRVPPGFLYRAMDWVPEMTMTAVPDERAHQLLEAAGGQVVHVDGPDVDAGGTVHRVYYVTC